MLVQIENRTLSKRFYIPIAITPWNNISTNICQPIHASSDLFTVQPISLHQLGQTITNITPLLLSSPGTPLHVHSSLLCGVQNQIYEIVHIENRVNLHNPPTKIFRFSLFIFFSAFSRVCFTLSVCVCVPKFICHTVQIHEHALAYLHTPWWWRRRWCRPRWG